MEKRKKMITPAPLAISGQNRAFPVIFHIKAISSWLFCSMGALARKTATAWIYFFPPQFHPASEDKEKLQPLPHIRLFDVFVAPLIGGYNRPKVSSSCNNIPFANVQDVTSTCISLIKVIEKLQGVVACVAGVSDFQKLQL